MFLLLVSIEIKFSLRTIIISRSIINNVIYAKAEFTQEI